MTTVLETENLAASVFNHLEADAALLAVIPTPRWVFDGAKDTRTDDLPEWILPTVLASPGRPSRGAKEARPLLQVGIRVRPGNDIHRSREIADAVGRALGNQAIAVGDWAGGMGGTVIGRLRTFDPDYVNLGLINGIVAGAVSVDGLFTPE